MQNRTTGGPSFHLDDRHDIFGRLGKMYIEQKRIRDNVAERNALINETGGYFSFGFAHIFVPKQKLAVQIGQVDCVHVDNMDTTETHQRQVLEKFTAQTSGADHQHLAK